jgi:hypothetical protein
MFAIFNGKFFVFQGRLNMRFLILVFLVLTLQACAPISYRETDEGRFEGALDVRWIKNDYFLFVPSKDDPFRFTRSNGEVIRPGPMYTDGGSIPRFLWGVNGYSPWGTPPLISFTIGFSWLMSVVTPGTRITRSKIRTSSWQRV